MKYLLLTGMMMICVAAGSRQTVSVSHMSGIPDTIATEIRERSDIIAQHAAKQIDSIMSSKNIAITLPSAPIEQSIWWEYVEWQYRTMKLKRTQ